MKSHTGGKKSNVLVWKFILDQRADTKNMEVGGTLEKKRFICQKYWFGEEELTVCYLSYYLQAKFSTVLCSIFYLWLWCLNPWVSGGKKKQKLKLDSARLVPIMALPHISPVRWRWRWASQCFKEDLEPQLLGVVEAKNHQLLTEEIHLMATLLLKPYNFSLHWDEDKIHLHSLKILTRYVVYPSLQPHL